MTPDEAPTTPELVKAARRALGWRQEQVAARLGVSHTTVFRWESGRCVPSVEHRIALARLLPDGDPTRKALTPPCCPTCGHQM